MRHTPGLLGHDRDETGKLRQLRFHFCQFLHGLGSLGTERSGALSACGDLAPKADGHLFDNCRESGGGERGCERGCGRGRDGGSVCHACIIMTATLSARGNLRLFILLRLQNPESDKLIVVDSSWRLRPITPYYQPGSKRPPRPPVCGRGGGGDWRRSKWIIRIVGMRGPPLRLRATGEIDPFEASNDAVHSIGDDLARVFAQLRTREDANAEVSGSTHQISVCCVHGTLRASAQHGDRGIEIGADGGSGGVVWHGQIVMCRILSARDNMRLSKVVVQSHKPGAVMYLRKSLDPGDYQLSSGIGHITVFSCVGSHGRLDASKTGPSLSHPLIFSTPPFYYSLGPISTLLY